VSAVALSAVALCALAIPAAAHAQTRPAGILPSIEAAAGVTWSRGADLGSADAALRTNDASATPYPVYSTATRLRPAPHVEARVGVRLRRRLAVEGRASLGHPTIATSVSADIEGAPGVTATNRLDAYRFDAGLVFHWPGGRVLGATPFVTGGGGYLRLRHEGRLLIEDKAVYFGGAGLRRTVWSAPGGVVTSVSIVGDGRITMMPGGLSIADGAVRTVTLSALVAAGF
jgi:hypothetical protein